MTEQADWPSLLQSVFRKTIQEFFQHQWLLNAEEKLLNDKGFIVDFRDTADMLGGIDILRVDRKDSFTTIHAEVIDPALIDERDVRLLVSDILRRVDEGFLIFIPLHDDVTFRYWYMTGTDTHEHEGIVIIKRADISVRE